MNFIHYFDLFGISFSQPYEHNQKIYKSKAGAFFTITIYTLSLMYFVYKIYAWLNGDINPKSAQTYQVVEQIDLKLDYPLITIYFDPVTNQMDPFNSTENIISAYFVSSQNSSVTSTLMEVVGNRLVLNNFNFSLGQKEATLYPTDSFLMLQICDTSVSKNCASKAKIDKFIQLSGITMTLQINFLYFNALKSEFEQITKSYTYAVETDMTLLNVMQLQMQNNIINSGFLFDNINELVVVNDVQFVSQSIKQSYFKNYFNNLIAVYELQLSELVQIQNVQYTKISEILADVGSIVSSLMIFKVIAVAINSFLLQEHINQQIIACYYPQFKDFKIKYNLLGKITQVTQMRSRIDVNDFSEFYNKAKIVASKKQTLINIIYEISRLQFLVQSLLDKSKIQQIRKLGIPIQLEQNNKTNTIVPLDESIQISDRDKLPYMNEDFELLTFDLT